MGKKAPKSPDPRVVAGAQTATNVDTSLANTWLQNGTTITADGTRSTTFDPNDSYSWTDSFSGRTYNLPKFTTTETLSPAQQAIKNQQDGADLNLATLGNQLSDQLKGKLTDNFKINNESTEARLMELGRKRLDPMLADRQAALETQLSNQGIKRGSAAFDKAMLQNTQGANDAYNQLALTGRAQATQEQFAEDNQRINQIGALLSNGQVSQPTFNGPNAGTMANTDVAGIYQQDFNNRMQRYQQKQAGIGGLLSGVGSLFALSDERAKTDIKKVGEVNGQDIHSYRYKPEYMGGKKGPIQLGLIAQKVEKKMPEAVIRGPDGLRRVNYSMALGLKRAA
jgi:hypothetical protein